MTRIGRWPPCTTSRPFAFSSSRLPASANSLFGASMSRPHAVVSFGGAVVAPSHRLHRHPLAQTRRAALVQWSTPTRLFSFAALHSLRRGTGPGAGLLVGAAERVPIRERVPDLLGCRLGLRAQLGEVDAGNNGALHHHLAVDDDGVDVVADAAFHDAFDGIAHRSVAQRVAPREID